MRVLEQKYYNRYVEQLRLLANKQLRQGADRTILESAEIADVPDLTRDLLLADTGVNVFVSSSVSLQFAPEKTNTVSAQVQARLPSDVPMAQRIKQAGDASDSLEKLANRYGIPAEEIVRSLLEGGQAVPVDAGIRFSANPSVGFDGGSFTLTLSAEQVLGSGTKHVTDRVTSHKIENATITALSYEPMVLSTLTSNVSYYTNEGGVPLLRRVPVVKDVLSELGLGQTKRNKGVFQSSLLILEPVVIPTIEDLVRFHDGWR
jgi:hypothetical protein